MGETSQKLSPASGNGNHYPLIVGSWPTAPTAGRFMTSEDTREAGLQIFSSVNGRLARAAVVVRWPLCMFVFSCCGLGARMSVWFYEADQTRVVSVIYAAPCRRWRVQLHPKKCNLSSTYCISCVLLSIHVQDNSKMPPSEAGRADFTPADYWSGEGGEFWPCIHSLYIF